MSREQWGHGYYKGLADGEKGKGKPKYLCTMKDYGYGVHVQHFYIIRERNGDIWTCELFDDPIDSIVLVGRPYVFDADEIDVTQYYEIDVSKEKYVTFYSQEAAMGFLMRDAREFFEDKLKAAKTEEERAECMRVLYGT